MNLFNSTGRRARVAGSILLLVVFVAGALAGAASERVMRADEAPAMRRGGASEMRGGSRRLLQDERFANELQLTAEQRTQVKAIMERRDREAKRVWAEAEPRLKAVGDATREEIRKVLTAEQVEKLEAEIEKRRSSWKDRHKCHAGDSARAEKKI